VTVAVNCSVPVARVVSMIVLYAVLPGALSVV
jgi:hypothetical protein